VKLLVVNCTKLYPSFIVAEDGRRFGNTQMLDHREVKDYAKWLGVVAGRSMLDAFEVALINDGMLMVWPVNEFGEPHPGECDALRIEHYDDGSRIVWEAKVECPHCDGDGHYGLRGEPVDEDDICLNCDGNGYTYGDEFQTDMDGNAVPWPDD
jgi:hypothetical protein